MRCCQKKHAVTMTHMISIEDYYRSERWAFERMLDESIVEIKCSDISRRVHEQYLQTLSQKDMKEYEEHLKQKMKKELVNRILEDNLFDITIEKRTSPIDGSTEYVISKGCLSLLKNKEKFKAEMRSQISELTEFNENL